MLASSSFWPFYPLKPSRALVSCSGRESGNIGPSRRRLTRAQPNQSQSTVEDKYSCPHGWTRYGNKKCLKYVNELQDYERAQAACRQKNQGTLVTIHSHEEQNFVYSYIHSIAASSTPIWLGAKQVSATEKRQSIKKVGCANVRGAKCAAATLALS